MELYIEPERPSRNPLNGRFLKGVKPHNYGKEMKYKSEKSKVKSLSNLEKGRGAWHKTGAGCNKKKVVAIQGGKLCGVFESIMDAEKKTGISASLISRICNKIKGHNTAGGFRWFFEKDDSWCNLIL